MMIYKPAKRVKHAYSIKSQNIFKKLLSETKEKILYDVRTKHCLCAEEINSDFFNPFLENDRHLSMQLCVFSKAIIREVLIRYETSSMCNLNITYDRRSIYYPHGLGFKKGRKRKPLVYTKEYIINNLRHPIDSILYRRPVIIKLGFLGTKLHKIFPFPRRVLYRQLPPISCL